MAKQAQGNITEENEVAPKSGRKLKKLIILILALLLIGGGAGFYFWRSSTSAQEAENAEKAAGENESKAEEEEPEDTSKPGQSLKSAIPKDKDVKNIIELQPFIVNLADKEQARYLRMTVSLGVGEEGKSEKPDQLFMTRVRNAMLSVLSDKNSEEILSIEGKTELRKELLKAAQAATDEPKVLAIYITDFIVQL